MKNLKRTLALTLVICILCSLLPVGVLAAETAPTTNLSTTGSPFQQGVGGSNSFRIPALVTLSDGTLVAAADARWNTTYDGGGLDTMVAISTDNGASWTHSFANYLGDNGNEYNGSSSTAFIDPALAVTSNDTIYMLVDLYPYGIALNGNVTAYPNTDTGFTDDGYLKLDYNSEGTYGYYLKDGKIYANGSNSPLKGYTVDPHFNVTNNNVDPATTTNLFFADSSIFKVARTGFLYLTKSTDGGKNWSAPQLLNLKMKNGTERVCLVGPGRGLVTKNGTIVFPVYSFPGDPTNTNAYTEQRLGFIYSTDGTNWQRSANLNYQWASESAVVELNDGTLRVFFRNDSKAVMYVDYNMTAKTWGTPVNTGVASNSNCQVSAISLNHTVGGKQVILVSCPQGATTAGDNNSIASARLNGKIHLFTVGENNALTKVSTVDVPSVHSTTNSFMYSCLTAQKDASGNETGNISILYEDQESAWGTGDNCYYQMSFKTFDVEKSFGVTFDDTTGDSGSDDEKRITMKVGDIVTDVIKDVCVDSDRTSTNVADVTWVGTTAEGETTEVLTASDLPTSGSVQRYISDGNGNYLRLNNGQLANTTNMAEATLWTITYVDTPSWGNGVDRYTIASGSYKVDLTSGVLSIGNSNINHYYKADTGFYGSSDGSNAWMCDSGNWTVGGIGTGNAKVYIKDTVTTEGAKSTTVTITAKAVGEATVEVGPRTYYITVEGDETTEPTVPAVVEKVELEVGASKTYTNTTGHEVVTKPDENIAKMTVSGINQTMTEVTSANFTAGKTYIIEGVRPSTADSTHSVLTSTEAGGGLAMNGPVNIDTSDKFTITPSGDKYTIGRNGEFVHVGNGSASMEANAQELTFEYVSGHGWLISNGNYYLSDLYGTGSQNAYGYGTRNDDGNYWKIYEVVPASTEVTFTGITPGNTTAVVGNTTYNITVTGSYAKIENVTLEVGETQVYTDKTGNYENADSNVAPDASIATMVVEGNTQGSSFNKVALTTIDTGSEFYIEVSNGVYLKADGTTTTNVEEAELWYAYTVTPTYCVIRVDQNSGNYLGVDTNGNLIVKQNPQYTKMENGVLKGYYSPFTTIGTPVTITGSEAVNETKITFKGIAPGKTSAVVGNTLYNITVIPAGIDYVVDIELEIGEDFTYTDTTGNYSNTQYQQTNGNIATMTVSGTANSTVKKLVPLTGATFDQTKRYVIENVRAKGNQADHSVLSSVEVTGGYTGLDMIEALNENSPTWIFTPDDNYYLISRNGEYLYFTENHASMENAAAQITVQYVEGKGFTLYFNGYYLSDWKSTDSGEAFGSATADDGIYWNIYEVVTEQQIDATKVTFTGVTVGNTTAVVGTTQYNITVVPKEVDDEVMNSATGIWTVDAEIQRQRYNALIGLHKDLYTDASWKEYETARQAAYKKLVEVTNKPYQTKAEAEAALDELTALVDALQTAHGKLVSATTIAVRYRLNTATGTLIDTREYKIASTDTSVTLPDTIVVGDIAYKVSNTTLNRQGAETSYDVVVTELGKIGGGFVGSADITGLGQHNGHDQICDLVNENNVGRKITEMTVTVGVSYDLNLATDTTGMTVTWTTDDGNVATVDQNGLVTAAGVGTTNIIATVKDANGKVVEVNSIPITVYPTANTNRITALYIENIDNTTVWCVVNGDTDTYGFQVIEGELIYGKFDTTVNDGSNTTAISFFGDPDEAHALVAMKSTNSDDHYFLLHDNDGNLYDGTQTGGNGNYYVSGQTSGAGWWQAVGLTDNGTTNTSERWQIVKDMVQWSIDLGCDGGLGFTRRQGEGHMGSNLTFISDPMARIEKEVDGVLPTSRKQANYRRYTENMVAAVHELVYFKITVTLEAPTQWKPQTDANGKIIRDSNGNIQYVTDENGNHFSAITYSSAMVTDYVLPGAYLYTKELDQADGTWDGEIAAGFRKQDDDVTEELNAPWTDDELAAGKRVLDYYLVYEIQESDIPKFYIDNIANLTYGYQSHYSKGAQAAAADAEARISVVGSAIDNVVIDFGQPFTYKGHEFTSITDGKTYTFTGLTNVHLKGAYVDGENGSVSKATAKYGDVKVYRKHTGAYDDKGYPEYTYTVTYTPHSILQGVDAVQIYGMGENDQEKVINGFLVYPATTVYYEEGFVLNNNNGWIAVNAEKATTKQTFELLGASQFDKNGMMIGSVSNLKHNYGYDPIYDGASAVQAPKSEFYTTEIGASTEFTFTGTGFELFADCTENSGYVSVAVTNAAGENVKMFMVNTVVRGGFSDATTGQTGNMNSLPIVSLKDLPHGTYTVTLTKVLNDDKTVTIDGVRITNTLADSSVYEIDKEDNPEFYQLRDMVLHSIQINAETSQDYEDLMGKAQQVYNDLFYPDAETEEPMAVITTTNEIYGGTNDPQDLLDKGPKNEVYLWPGQKLTFNVTTSRLMQVALKAPRGATTYTIKVTYVDENNNTVSVTDKTADLNTTVDMFYKLDNTHGVEREYTIHISNQGNDMLAITDLKVCDDPNAKFNPLTYDTIVDILKDAGYTDGTEPEVPEQPEQPEVPMFFVDVPEGAFYYLPVVWAVKNGITNGVSLSHFGSEMDCNRAQVVTFLWRAAGSPEPTSSNNPFVDVEAGSFYEKAVLWAVEKGITNGTDATHFSPNLTCNRASVVTFLYRAFEQPVVENAVNPFNDVPADSWYTNAVLWAVEQEITVGIGNGLFGVDGMCNRAQIVTFLYRAYN